jgi:indolepyruvate ferredoxin oxidoreductase alpha subunit
VTTRICHSKSVVLLHPVSFPKEKPHFVRDIKGRVMIPAYARPAHRRLRQKLAEIETWNDNSNLNPITEGNPSLGIVTSGVSFAHAREAAPDAHILKLGMTYPLPMKTIRTFVESVNRCVIVEEGDPYLATAIRAAGIPVEDKPGMYRFGEFTVERVRRILARDETPEPVTKPGKPSTTVPRLPASDGFSRSARIGVVSFRAISAAIR